MSRRRAKRDKEPLEVRLSFTIRTGNRDEDEYRLLRDKRVPMVGSVFQYRDKAARFLALSLMRVAAMNKSVLRSALRRRRVA